MKKVNFDNFADTYNDHLRRRTKFFSSDENYFSEYKVKITRTIILNEPKRILEYGCGIGRNIRFLRLMFQSAELFGSDISEKSLDVAKSENPDVYFWLEGDKLAEKTGFDLIFVAGVFHHIPKEKRKSVAEMMYDRLNYAGSVVVFEHNPYNPVTRRIVSSCPYDRDAVLLPPSELLQILGNAKFSRIKQSYTLFFPPSFKIFSALESKIGWIPLGGQYWVHAVKV